LGVGLLDQSSDPRERFAAPVIQLPDLSSISLAGAASAFAFVDGVLLFFMFVLAFLDSITALRA